MSCNCEWWFCSLSQWVCQASPRGAGLMLAELHGPGGNHGDLIRGQQPRSSGSQPSGAPTAFVSMLNWGFRLGDFPRKCFIFFDVSFIHLLFLSFFLSPPQNFLRLCSLLLLESETQSVLYLLLDRKKTGGGGESFVSLKQNLRYVELERLSRDTNSPSDRMLSLPVAGQRVEDVQKLFPCLLPSE